MTNDFTRKTADGESVVVFSNSFFLAGRMISNPNEGFSRMLLIRADLNGSVPGCPLIQNVPPVAFVPELTFSLDSMDEILPEVQAEAITPIITDYMPIDSLLCSSSESAQ